MKQHSLTRGAEAFPEFTRELGIYAAMSCREEEGTVFICPRVGSEEWLLHVLYAPLSAVEIAEIEQELRVILPDAYKCFLALWNGATLFCYDEIWGKMEPSKAPGFRPAFDVVEENQVLREHVPDFQTHLFGIASYSYGDVICLDLSDRTNDSATVRVWDHEVREVTAECWSSLREWLAYEMQEGKEVWAPRLAKGAIE